MLTISFREPPSTTTLMLSPFFFLSAWLDPMTLTNLVLISFIPSSYLFFTKQTITLRLRRYEKE